jgi:hypothetical protein
MIRAHSSRWRATASPSPVWSSEIRRYMTACRGMLLLLHGVVKPWSSASTCSQKK